jgi:hypothetical protein
MSASENLPPFSGRNTACPKCGYRFAKATWHSRGIFHAGFPCEHRRGLAEHMCRTCPGCKYGWIEATKDAAGEPQRLRPAR